MMHRNDDNVHYLSSEEEYARIGRNVKSVRQVLCHLTRKQLSKELGKSEIYVKIIEDSRGTYPVTRLIRICQLLKVTPNTIFWDDDGHIWSEINEGFLNTTFDDAEIGRRIDYFMKNSRFSDDSINNRHELLDRLNRDQSYIDAVKEGRVSMAVHTFLRLCTALGIDADTFFHTYIPEEKDGDKNDA